MGRTMYQAQFLALIACAAACPPALDRHGFELPPGAVARLGSSALRGGGYGFDLTPDGKHIVTAGNPAWLDGGEIRVWDVSSSRLLRSFDHRWARSVVVSPDGKRAAVCGVGDASFWELETGRRLWTYPPNNNGEQASCAIVSPDGRLVAVGGRHVTLLNADTGTPVRTITRREQSNNVSGIAFTPDGAFLAVEDLYEIRLWDVATGRLVRTLDGRVTVSALAITPDGKHLLAAVWDNKNRGVPVWDVATGKRVRTLAGHDHVMTAAVAVSPDGRWVATAGGPALNIADRTTGTDHDIHLYDAATGERRHVLPGQPTATAALRFTPDSKTLLTGDAVVRFWDVATGRQLRRTDGHEAYVSDLAFVGEALISAGADGTVRTWNPRTGEQLGVVSVGSTWAKELTLSPDGKRVCSVQGTGVAVVAEVATGAEVDRVKVAPNSRVRFTPAGDGLRAAGWQSDYVLLTFGRPAVVRKAPPDQLGQGGFSPDGETAWRVVSAAPKQKDDRPRPFDGPKPPFDLVLWDVVTGNEIRRFRLPENSTWTPQPAWSPDGKLIAVGNYGVTVWDVKTGRQRTDFWRGPVLDSAPVWSPDGRRIAFSQDSEVICWDLATDRLAFRLPLGRARSRLIRWSLDGKLLVAATGSMVLVYPVPAD